MPRSLLKLLLFASLLLALSGTAVALAPVVPGESCFEIQHFPPQPIGDAPSKTVLFVALPPEWGGGSISVVMDGASGPQQGTGPVAPDGLATAELPLFFFGSHQITELTVNNQSAMAPIDVDSLVDGGAFNVNDSEPTCDPASITRVVATTTTTAAPTTTTAAPTTTTAARTTTTTTAPTTTTSPVTTDESTDLFPWILIALGGIFAVIGGFLLARKSCAHLYRLWQAAQRRYEICMEELTKAQAWLEEKRAARSLIEQELERLQRSAGMGSISDGRNKYQSLPGEGLVTEEGMGSIIETIQGQLEAARQAETMGEEMVNRWREETDKAAAEAESARKAYEECIGALTPKASGEGTTSGGTVTGGTVTGAGPGLAVGTTTQEDKCPKGDSRSVPIADGRTFRVIRAFRIETETQGEAMVGESGQQMAADLRNLGAELGFLGSLIGGYGAGSRIGESLVRTGSAFGVVRGGAEAYGAAKGNLGTDSFPIPKPTSPGGALVGVLQPRSWLPPSPAKPTSGCSAGPSPAIGWFRSFR